MTLNEIKAAVKAGKTVHWVNNAYVCMDTDWGIMITYIPNGDCIALTHKDGVTLNGKEEDFYISE